MISCREYSCVLGCFIFCQQENQQTENVLSLRSGKGATLPCAAHAVIPYVLAVRKQMQAKDMFSLRYRLRLNRNPDCGIYVVNF